MIVWCLACYTANKKVEVRSLPEHQNNLKFLPHWPSTELSYKMNTLTVP